MLPLVSKAAPYLASGLSGTYPLKMGIGKYNSDAASSGKKEVSPNASTDSISLGRSGT